MEDNPIFVSFSNCGYAFKMYTLSYLSYHNSRLYWTANEIPYSNPTLRNAYVTINPTVNIAISGLSDEFQGSLISVNEVYL